LLGIVSTRRRVHELVVVGYFVATVVQEMLQGAIL
jgi:hypothetical protein